MTTIQVWQRPVLVRPVKEVVDAAYSFVAGDEVRVVEGNRGTGQTFTIYPEGSRGFAGVTVTT